jgi:DNA-binding transcriptional LysR family regulator
MNLRSVDLNLLCVFDAIFVEGNLTRAARRLAISQPAMSNALARLRSTLGDPLFTRTATGMTPTPRARMLAAPIRQALDLIQNAVTPPTAFDFRSSARRFTVAVEDYGEAVIIPRVVDWLCRVAPSLRLDVRPNEGASLREALLEGAVELGISYFRFKSREFRNCMLMEDSVASMVRQDHPTVGDSLSLDQYLALSHVILMPRTSRLPVIDRALAELGLERIITLEVPHFLSMPLIVKNTNLICSLPRRMANVYAENFRLRILKTPVEFPAIPVYMSWHQSVDGDAGHAWLRDSIRELCQRL